MFPDRNLELPGILVHALGSPAAQGSLPLVLSTPCLCVYLSLKSTSLSLQSFERTWGLPALVN